MLGENPSTRIRLLGINSADSASSNALMVAGRDLPWLQDRLDTLAWNSWNVDIDDVFIVDENGVLVEVYPLLSYDLADPANYAELKAKLKAAAGE